MNDTAFKLSYILCKQLPTAYEISSNYGGIELDDELRQAVEAATRPIIERRLRASEQAATPDPFEALAALYLDLSPTERETLSVFIECFHNHNAQAAHADLIRRGLRDVVNEGTDELACNEGAQP